MHIATAVARSSQFMGKLAKQNIGLNRKVLADLAMNNPKAFEAIINSVK